MLRRFTRRQWGKTVAGIAVLAATVAGAIDVGPGLTHTNLRSAADIAGPGDTILIHDATYDGGHYIAGLEGTEDRWIIIRAYGGSPVVEGSSEAWHLVEPAYVRIEGMTFRGQSANGVNVDDGGTYDTPAHHVVFDSCAFEDMTADGNHDLLKLSGLDHFTISNCTFRNGASGGSGVDMVGCHNGVIEISTFENMGSNAIQAKGGTQFVRITRNRFVDCGNRTLNLGGSTGLDYFRPDTARFEAADLDVFANVFTGSRAPIAYVGCVRVRVVNNTFYKPGHWVIRILQETVDPSRFVECGSNAFVNNIVYLGNAIATECNVGPNTRPETFSFSNNLWYHHEQPSWDGPSLPVEDRNSIVGSDPKLAAAEQGNVAIDTTSPAYAAGTEVADVTVDFDGQPYAALPSIGAVEAPVADMVRQRHSSPRLVGCGRNSTEEAQFDIRGRLISARTAAQALFLGPQGSADPRRSRFQR